MALNTDLLDIIDARIRASRTALTSAGTIVEWTPPTATVLFDGSSLAVPVRAFNDVDGRAGDRCGLVKFASDWVVVGIYSVRDRVLFARKTVNTVKQSNTTLQADPHLFLTLAAHETYAVTGYLVHSIPGSIVDIKVDFTFPANATLTWGGAGPDPASVANVTVGTGQWASHPEDSSSPAGTIEYGSTFESPAVTTTLLAATVVMGDTAGDLALRWAQLSSNSAQSIMRKNSWLRAEMM